MRRVHEDHQMSNTNTGGPAFPRGEIQTAPGMTLRDYFAAKAMQAFLERAPTGTQFGVSHTATNETFGVAAYAMANAMLKAREA
jgi:hypothetical protein